MAKDKEVLQKGTVTKKEFDYTKGDVNLNFTLSMENSSQLRRFLICLQEAQKDLEVIIAEMKN